MNNEVVFGKNARDTLLNSVNIICDAVKITLGPKGKNAIIASDYANPRVLNDGVTIAKEIELQNELDNVGIAIVKEAAIKTNDLVGDGTTTSLVILQSLFNKGIELINEGYNPIKLNKELNQSLSIVIDYIKNKSINNITSKEIRSVASISSEDKNIGKLIDKIIRKITKKGNIVLEDSIDENTTLEFINGMEISNGFVSSYLIGDNKKFEELKDVKLYIIDKEISLDDINFIEEDVNKLLLCEDFEEEVINYFIENNRKNNYKTILVKLPMYGEKRKEIIKDISVFINKDYYDITSSGKADKVKIYKDKTIIINEKVNQQIIKKRIEFIKEEIRECNSDFEKDIYENRMFNLLGKTALIKVGAQTELERIEKKMRIEDSINSVKNAINGGVSLGGGITYYNAAKYLNRISNTKGAQILCESLITPLKQILINNGLDAEEIIDKLKDTDDKSGYDAETEEFVNMEDKGILDSTNVLLEALKSSMSITCMLLTSEVIIINKKNRKDSLLNINESL